MLQTSRVPIGFLTFSLLSRGSNGCPGKHITRRRAKTGHIANLTKQGQELLGAARVMEVVLWDKQQLLHPRRAFLFTGALSRVMGLAKEG